MKPWHEGLPETRQFVVFPPLGQEGAFESSKERISAHLRQAFPDLEFELANSGLYEDVSILPICGTVGDGATGGMKAPPSEMRIQEIERELKAFDLAGSRLS